MKLQVSTIDAAQGKEADCIVLMTTRTRGGASPFQRDHRRVNVAITRAKRAMVIVGDATTMGRAEPWKQ